MTQRTPAQYDWSKALFNDRRITKHFTSPRRSKISHVTLHHMDSVSSGSDSSNAAVLEGCYKTWMGSREASANYGVAGDQVWQFVSDNDAAWSDANSTSNHSTLSIEHADSTGSPSYKIADRTMATGQRLVANLHVLYGLGRPSRTTVKVHRDFYPTACPGPYMMDHLNDYITAAGRIYDEITGKSPAPTPVATPPATKDASWSDPSSFVLGATGPDVVRLGERLVVWSKALGLPAPYKVGPSSPLTPTDVDAVQKFQVAQGWTGADADGYPGPTTLKILASDPPVAAFRVVTWNIKSPTLLGWWPGWTLRRSGQVKIITEAKPSVFLGQEFGSPTNVKWYDAALAKIGLINARAVNSKGSGKWRVVYHDDTWTRVTAGLYTIGPRIDGDTKEMAETVLTRDGVPWYFGSFHLENQSGAKYDTLRVAQIADVWRRAMQAAKTHGIDPEHVVFGGDTNSANMVREWVEKNTDYRDAAGIARTATDTADKSINSWKPLTAGTREDYVFVHKNSTVELFDQLDGHKVSDHNPQIVDL